MKKRPFSLWLILAYSAFSQQAPQIQLQLGGGPPNPAMQPKPPAVGDATVEGRVVNGKTGEPLRRVAVTLRPFGAPSVAIAGVAGMSPTAPYAATTDAEGKFRFEKVEAGTYRLYGERQGFLQMEYGSRVGMSAGTPVSLTANQELKGLEFKLTPQAVIAGKVLDEEGEPVANVGVQAMRHRYIEGKKQLMPMGMVQTTDTGEFRLSMLQPGRYWLRAIIRQRTIFGDQPARNSAGKPEEAYIPTYYPGVGDLTSAQLISVEPGQELMGMDVRLQKARVYRVRGKIQGVMQGRVQLGLFTSDQTSVFDMGSGIASQPKEDGTFELANVRPGSYSLLAMRMESGMTILAKVPIEVRQENLENVSVALGTTGSVTGTIRIDGDIQKLPQRPMPSAMAQNGPQGQPGAGKVNFSTISLFLSSLDGFMFNPPNARAKEDGTFSISNVGPDRYRISVPNPPYGTWVKSVLAGGQEVLESGVDIPSGATVNLEVVLAVGTGELRGTVLDASQQPATRGLVTLLSEKLKPTRFDQPKMVPLTKAGEFRLSNLPPGDYRIMAIEDGDPTIFMDPEFLAKHSGSIRNVSIKANEKAQIDITQIPASAPQ